MVLLDKSVFSNHLIFKDELEIWHTSTFHPLFFINSHNSREVLTFPVSTAVHVGKIAPSPLSEAVHAAQFIGISLTQAHRLTDFIVSKDYTSISSEKFNRLWQLTRHVLQQTYLVVSCRMSFFSLFSIASRFSARSEIESVDRGSDASRKTNGLPEI